MLFVSQTRSDTGSTPSGKRANYHLSMPVSLHKELEAIAKGRQISIAELMRQFLRLGVVASKLQESPDSRLCVAEGDKIQQIIVL